MSTICLAAQRSYHTGEAVWFSYHRPPVKKVLLQAAFWLLSVCVFIIAGVYAHIYWQCQHPTPPAKPVKMENPDVRLSEMHYVYISKPFPQPKPEPRPAPLATTPMQSDGPTGAEDDWQQAPDGDLSDQALPGAQEPTLTRVDQQTPSLEERFLQALQEQKADYAQGKIPAPPEDETLNGQNTTQKSENGRPSPAQQPPDD